MNKPIFFLSSTIIDFKDLRSASKFYLEEMGCVVLASEFNDFIKPIDEGTLEACLKALHGCHYYLLFIGNRTGSWFDESNRISITRKEYQYAYQLHLQKKIHLIMFVRSEILNMFENRKKLSDVPGDLNAVFEFIEEVRMPIQVQANAYDPSPVTGNWLHQFTTFRDIVDTLQALVFYGKSIDRKALESLLSRELRDLLKSNLIKEKKAVFSPKEIIKDFCSRIIFTKIDGPETSIKVNSTDWDRLWYYSIHIMKVDFVTPILQYALESNAFLTYQVTENKFKESAIYDLLLRLRKEIKFFNSTKSDDMINFIFEHTRRSRSGYEGQIEMNAAKLLGFLFALNRWTNILELSKTILIRIDGNTTYTPDLLPWTPIEGKDEENSKDLITDAELDQFLGTE